MYHSALFALLALLTALGSSVATVTAVIELHHDNAYKPVPRFANGFTAFLDRDAQTVTCYGASGKQQFQIRLQLPDVARVGIVDVTGDSKGRVVVAGSAYDVTGRYASTVLIWIEPDGLVSRVVRPEGFAVRRVRFTPQGSLLAIGGARDSSLRETPSHDMVREYDSGGRLLRTLAPRTLFSPSREHPTGEALVTANSTSFGILSLVTNTYAEYSSSSGAMTGKWDLRLPAEVDISGAGLTEAGRLYLGGSMARTGALVGYELDRTNGALLPLALPQNAQAIRLTGLLGAEGDSLVLSGVRGAIVKIRP